MKVTQTRWNAPFSMATHRHADSRVVVVLTGSFDERFGNLHRSCEPGTAIYRPPDERHSEIFKSKSGAYISAALPKRWFAPHASADLDLDRSLAVRSESVTRIGGLLAMELTRRDAWTPLAVDGLVLELLADIARKHCAVGRRPPLWLDDVCDAITECPEQPWRLAELGRLAGRHPAHVVRAFRLHLGTTVGAFVRMQRLETARRLVAQGKLSLCEISTASGFYDQGHLCRAFKARYGVTPSWYRSHARLRDPRTFRSS